MAHHPSRWKMDAGVMEVYASSPHRKYVLPPPIIVVRDSKSKEEQPIYNIFPDLQEFSNGDLFSPHAADAEFWCCGGRSDDLQVFRSGVKYHPVALHQL